jgi:ubiquinone biosynthesis protein COQ9
MASRKTEKTPKSEPDLLVMAFEAIAAEGWRSFRLSTLAEKADLPLAAVRAELPCRAALLTRLGARLDKGMLDLPRDELAELEPRERVFELIMRRLDAMAPFKAGLATLGREARLEPDVLLASVCNVARLTGWLLDVAGVRMVGIQSFAARKLLALIYVRTFSVWLKDDTPDHARTLAELDKRLRQAENLARWMHRTRAGATPAAA